MINKRIFNMLGYVLLFLGVSMIFSAIWSYIDNSDDLTSILNSSLITSIAGLFLIIITQLQFLKIYPYITIKDTDKVDLSHKDGYTLVTLSWVMMTIFGSLPFYLYGPFENYIDAFFESISGLTTTGATILAFEDYSIIPRGLMFWRSLFSLLVVLVLLFLVLQFYLMGFGGVSYLELK